VGGFPRGQLTELLGSPTSGKTTIALRLLAAAQRLGERVAYVDLPATFDPEYAAWCGVDLATLLLVRPQQAADAPDLILALLSSGALGALVVDDLAALQTTPQCRAMLDRMLRQLPRTLARSPCALVILTALPYRPDAVRSIGFHGSGLAHAAALRLHIAREAWLDDPATAVGCRARITVLKHTHAPAGSQAHITIPFDDDWSVV
jgi:recombination protein RecA